MLTDLIQKLIDRQDLSGPEARGAMEEIMSGLATDAQIAAFLVSLRIKHETAEEVAALAEVMREKAQPFWDGDEVSVLDTCSTGGGLRSGAFNISTTSAFIVSGAGIRVAKHGNRSVTRCGAADVMEALGIDIQAPIPRLRAAVKDVGIAFLFAQRFHDSMKHVAPVRSQLKLRTVFNLLGPLSNPARPRFQVVGVFGRDVQVLMAQALDRLGVEHAFVVHGADGLDEISITGQTFVQEIRKGELKAYTISPEDFGIPVASAKDLEGGDRTTNARIIESILGGEKGPRRNVALLNAAPALVAAGAARDFMEGLRLAADSIDTGAALAQLNSLREWR